MDHEFGHSTAYSLPFTVYRFKIDMKKATRAIIFWTFVILFFISAPVVLLYTAGYRIDFARGRLAQVGALVLKSTPRDATIILNGKTTDGETPTSMKLAPDEYRILVQKPGYHPWQKLLPVQSRVTTFAEDIILWKQTEPARVLDAPVTSAAFAPDQRHALFIDDAAGLRLFDSTTGTTTHLETLRIGHEKPRLSISRAGMALARFVTPAATKEFFAVSIVEPLVERYLSPFGFTDIALAENPGTFYGVKNGTLFAINFITGRSDAVSRSGAPFIFKDTTVWSIGGTTPRPVLVRSSAGDVTSTPVDVLELPRGTYEFLDIDSPYLLLHEQKNDRLLLIDTREPALPLLHADGIAAQMRVNRDGELEVLYWNQFELWRLNVAQGTPELLRRQSDPIRTAAWYPRGEYVLFASGDHLEALELDSRDARNLTMLASFPDHRIEAIAPDARGTELYFAVTGGPDAGLYSLELQ